MEEPTNIPPSGIAMEHESAQHVVFQQFLTEYEPLLTHVEHYLEETIEKTNYIYREAYIPWQKALHELLEGVYYLSRKIPVPSKEKFQDALFMFSFKSAIIFLHDICVICQIKLKNGWEQDFQENINRLLSSLTIIDHRGSVA